MTAYVTTAAGRTFQLPVPLSWELNYTAGGAQRQLLGALSLAGRPGHGPGGGSDSPQRRRARQCFPGWWTSAR